MDPTAMPAPQGGPSPMGLPDLQTPPTPFNGAQLPVLGPDPSVVTIDQVMQLLRDDRLRGFRIDVETDSLIEADQQAEKQQRTEFVQSVGEFIAKVGPIAQAMPPLAPLVGGLLQFAVRGFKVGQELEELIETTMHKAGMLLENPPPKQPSPDEQIKLEGIKAKVQAEIAKAQIGAQQAQADAQAKMQQTQADMQMKAGELQARTQADQQKAALDQQNMQATHQLETSRMLMQMEHDRERHHMEMQRTDQSHQQAMEQKQADAEQRKADAKKRGAD